MDNSINNININQKVGRVEPAKPVDVVKPNEKDQFSDLLKKSEEDRINLEAKEQEEMTPEELRADIMKHITREGVKRSMDKAIEISKEIKGE